MSRIPLYVPRSTAFSNLTLANEVDVAGGPPDQQQPQPQQQQPKQEAPAEWKLEECDRFSFDDSDRFEEDSLCSWSTEPESLCNNWRGWKKPVVSSSFGGLSKKGPEDQVSTLTELAAKCVASFIPFELVEHVFPPVPEQLQLRIAFWSFPDNEEDIRLYSCLANSSADEFHRGDHLFKTRAVKEPLQIGFHLSATVISQQPRTQFNVAVTFDRRRISSCNCTCTSNAYWCSHVVAVCLHRIHCPNEVTLRAPVSESLTRLQRDQLQKFAQYLISELPQQILPTAQRLLDELLSSQPTAINTVCGAPDPTAGASANDLTNWYLDEKTLHDNIKKILIKFCLPAPMVFSDVNYLTNSAPPAAAEWSSLLRPLRGREPEGMWNLLSIVREMYRRCDRNAVRLLEIITEECMACDQILVWWFNTKLSLLIGTNGHNGGKHSNTHSNSNASQHACSSLCDEIVVLWRLAALNPGLAPEERDMLHAQFTTWHLKILDRVAKSRVGNSSHNNKQQQTLRTDAELFIGFKPAIEACYLDWEDYPIAGITHTQDTNPMYHSPFTCFKHTDGSKSEANSHHVNSSQAILSNNVKHYQPQNSGHHTMRNRKDRAYRERCYVSSSNNSNSSSDSVNVRLNSIQSVGGGGSGIGGGVGIGGSVSNAGGGGGVGGGGNDGNRSSTGSEGFCENEDEGDSGNNGVVEMFIPSKGCIRGGFNGMKQIGKFKSKDDNNEGVLNSLSSSSSNDSIRRVLKGVCIPTTSSNDDRKVLGVEPVSSPSSTPPSSSSSVFSSSSGALEKVPKEMSPVDNRCVDELATIDVAASNEVSSQTTPTNDGKQLKRRSSKDGNTSSSESQQSAEDYKLYYFESKGTASGASGVSAIVASDEISVTPTPQQHQQQPAPQLQQQQQQQSTPLSTTQMSANYYAAQASTSHPLHAVNKANESKSPIFSNLKPTEDAWDILFARAEGLHAHGHGREACILAVRLAEELLSHPPNLMIELPPPPKRKGKKQNINPLSHQLTVLASATLAKCAFLCTVLAENSEHYHLAFRICLFGLELPRPPASTKPLEVKLANQEADLLALLKRIPLGVLELKVIRDRAENLRDGTLKSRGEALLPIMLASFIFDALVMPGVTGKETRCKVMTMSCRFPTDENLGFEAAVAALGLKANVSEAEHPLLCEGTRRQRGELALTLLYCYKDDSRKIAKIMEKLLDREIHVLIKSPLHHAYYSSNPPIRTAASHRRDDHEMTLQYHNDPLAQNQGGNNSGGGEFSGANSRPHSSTSAELENSMNTLSMSSQNNTPTATASGTSAGQAMTQTATVTSTRSKDRFKGKRAYPSIPNQPSEASAHFMFELAKNVLTKAGGTSSTSLFTQASTNQNHHGPHRALHMCAFQLGLYALGLHNCVSPNWLSRTYSSHVSWILGQAMEIGAPAISFLIDTWEGHLTPPEAASMADRASRGWDSNMVYPAAELALSVLPHAAALNPNEIQRAILQCKEQSDQMLERACITVESAAKGGGVYPEVLFQVARYWYELYIRNTPGGELEHEPNDMHLDHNVSLAPLMESPDLQQQQQQQQQPNQPPPMQNQQVVVTATPPQPFQQAVTTLAPIGISHYGPYSFACQGIYAHHHNIPFPHNQMQMYISTPQQFPYPPPHNGQQQPPNYGQPAPFQPMAHPPVAQSYQPMQCPSGQQYPGVQVPVGVGGPPPNNGHLQPNLQYYNAAPVSLAPQPPPPQSQNQLGRNQPPHHGGGGGNGVGGNGGVVYPFVQAQPVRRHPHQFSPTQLRYLLAAYNVGMLAMETLARRVHDDRPQAKYARNPPYGEDVKWLLRISKKLGTQYLHQFCVCAVNSIVSPFVLQDVAIESAHYLARNNPTLVMQHLRSALTPLVQKCQQMYIQCIHQKLYHLTSADYEEFSNIILSARAAFHLTPEGNAQFKDWLQSIRRSKSCKKDLWAQINATLQTNSK